MQSVKIEFGKKFQNRRHLLKGQNCGNAVTQNYRGFEREKPASCTVFWFRRKERMLVQLFFAPNRTRRIKKHRFYYSGISYPFAPDSYVTIGKIPCLTKNVLLQSDYFLYVIFPIVLFFAIRKLSDFWGFGKRKFPYGEKERKAYASANKGISRRRGGSPRMAALSCS